MPTKSILTLAVLLFGAATLTAAEGSPATGGKTDYVAAAKESLQTSMEALHQYEWVETTVVSLDGEAKSTTMKNCYYGADGTLEKTPVPGETPAETKKHRGLRGRIAAKKKEDVSSALNEATALVKQYVPPDPKLIQSAKEAGRLTLTPPDADGRVQIVIHDYLKEGDSLTLDLSATAERILNVAVSTYTEKAKDAVDLTVQFGQFTDQPIVYAETVNLAVAKENLDVKIENSGYRKLGG